MKHLGGGIHNPSPTGRRPGAQHRPGTGLLEAFDSPDSLNAGWTSSHRATATLEAVCAMDSDRWSEREIWPDCVD